MNAGNLTVQPGQDLALLGRNVINSGRLSAPGGEVLVLATQGHQQVRLSSPDMILNLEVEDAPVSAGTGVTALDLPSLLTVGASALNTQPTLTIAADGIPLPTPATDRPTPVLSHPYYWAAFTLVGSPW